jgi:hypothetical protein
MVNTPHSTDLRKLPTSPVTAAHADEHRTVHPHTGQLAANPSRRRFGWDVIGFWLGGAVLGGGGCILGACMPYRHPVGVAISVLWWGIYLGCFGASLGALFGLWTARTPASPSQESDGADKPPSGAADPAVPAGYSCFLSGANWSGTGAGGSTTCSLMDAPGP